MVARLTLFGSPRIEGSGCRVEAFPTRRCLYLLARLALSERRRLTRRDLAAVLWPDEPYDTTGLRLRQELTRLRKALGELSPLVEADLVYVSLAPHAVETDVEQFEAAVRDGRLSEAVEISREPLLEGALEDWIVAERRRLNGLRYRALLDLSEAYTAQGETEEALRLATVAIDLLPHQEEAHLRAMRHLATKGHAADALGQFQTLRRLARESGKSGPSPLAEGLAEEIRNPRQPLEAGNVEPLGLVGRSDEWQRLVQRLHPGEGQTRLVSVLGPGGVGKTHLLRSAVRTLARPYNGLVAWVDLSEIAQAELVPDTVLRELGLPHLPSADPLSQLESALPKAPFLLALDNLEQFGPSIRPLLSRLLQARPRLRLLVGSRTAMNLADEFRLPLSPLPVPSEGADDDGILTSPAVRLLIEMAETAGVRLMPEDTDWPAVAQIARKLEGMPLGIRLAVPRLRTETPIELLRVLERDPVGLNAAEEGVPDRQRSLRRAIARSFDLLPPELRGAMIALSVFRGGWTAASAAEVIGLEDATATMGALLDASLIERTTEKGSLRFRMLDSIQTYAASLLPAERAANLRRRHLEWLLRMTEVWRGKPVDEPTLDLFVAVERETENLREAMHHAMATDAEAAFHLAGNLGPFWFYRTSGFEANEVYRELFERYGKLPPTSSMLHAALGQSWIVLLLTFPGHPEIYQRGIDLGHRLGDRSHEATFLAFQGIYAQNAMEYAYGEETMRAIDQTAAEVGVGDAVGLIARLKGYVALYQGDFPSAIDQFRTAVRWYRARGEVYGYASARLHLAFAAIEYGDLTLAEATLENVIESIQRNRFDALIPSAHGMDGHLLAGRGDFEGAIERFTVARDLLVRHASHFRAFDQDWNIGHALYQLGRYSEAGERFAAAAEGWYGKGYPFATAVGLLGVSGALWRMGESEGAKRIMSAAQRQFAISQARKIRTQARFEEELMAEMASCLPCGDLDLEEAVALAKVLSGDI